MSIRLPLDEKAGMQAMTNQERAEKIVQGDWAPMGCDIPTDSQWRELEKRIAAQIEEAEREARNYGPRDKCANEQRTVCLSCVVDKAYAEGFRAAKKKARGIALEELGMAFPKIVQCIGEMEP